MKVKLLTKISIFSFINVVSCFTIEYCSTFASSHCLSAHTRRHPNVLLHSNSDWRVCAVCTCTCGNHLYINRKLSSWWNSISWYCDLKEVLWGGTLAPHKLRLFSPLPTLLFHEHLRSVFNILHLCYFSLVTPTSLAKLSINPSSIIVLWSTRASYSQQTVCFYHISLLLGQLL